MAVKVSRCLFTAFLVVGICQAQFSCHCKTGCPVEGEYNPTEYCHGDCQPGYFDRYCQTKNVALKKTAWQSTTYSEYIKRFGNLVRKFLPNTPDRAVDGNANIFYPQSSCTHTEAEIEPYWAVDLGREYTVNKIVIYQRSTYTERLTGFEILVDGVRCYRWERKDSPPIRIELKCDRPIRGQNVTIRLPERSDRRTQLLTLCEVLILVCEAYWFGEDCDRTCHCRDLGEVCDPVTGHCQSGCPSGYIGDGCMRRGYGNSTRSHVLIKQITLAPSMDATPTPDNHLTSGDITAIFFGMLIAVFVSAAIVVGYRRWREKRDTQSSDSRYADLSNRPATTEHLYVGIDTAGQTGTSEDKDASDKEANFTQSENHYEFVGEYHGYLEPLPASK